jgi:Domain of Unknown Function (DUF928)
MRLSQTIKALTLVLLLNTIPLIEFTESAIAAPRRTSGTVKARPRLTFRMKVRPSRYSFGGFSRAATSTCGPTKNATVTALVPPPLPEEPVTTEYAPVDKTIAERPTFLVDVPNFAATNAQFILQPEHIKEGEQKQIYNKKFQLTGKSGIIAIPLPSSVPALQIGQKYLWQMTITCSPRNIIAVMGWIERVQTPTTAAGDKLNTLAEAGVWQDTVSTLALRRYEQPNDRTAAEDWASLMEDVKMSQFKDTAIVQIVKD